MAYKFQLGDAIMSGALKQEGDLDLLDNGALKVNGVQVISNLRVVSGSKLDGQIQNPATALELADTDDVAEGASNLYYTDARARASVSVSDLGGDGSLSYNSSTGVISYTGPSAAEVRAHLSAGEMIDYAGGEFSINAATFSASADVRWDAKMAAANTGDLAEGSNLYFTDARARGAISVTDAGGDGSLAYDNSTGVITYTGPSAAEVRAHLSAGEMIDFAGGEFSINAATFSASADVRWDAKMAAADTGDLAEGSNLYWTTARGESMFDTRLATKDTDDLAEGSNLYFTDARARAAISVVDAGGDGSMAYDNSTGVLTYTGPSAAEVRAHMSGGEMIDFASGVISINAAEFSASADVRWDAKMAAADTGDLAEGSNLYWTTARGESMFDTRLATKDTGDLAEGSNLYFTDARARAAISVVDAGGDGSLAYDNSTGVITFTGPSAAEVRAHMSGGEMIDFTSGVISIIPSQFSGSAVDVVADASAASAVRSHLAVADTDGIDMSYNSGTGVFSADLLADSRSFAISGGNGLELASGVAGAGLTLSAGVLSIDGAVVNGVGDAAATLVEGFNHGTADLTADRKWTLPASPVAGDVVHVKAPLLAGNVLTVEVSNTGTQNIDGGISIILESDSGAVSLMAVSATEWRIF
jgi:uncharacterized protein involved in tellurium resistance